MPRVSDLQRAFSNLTLFFLYLGQLTEQRGARRSLATTCNSFRRRSRHSLPKPGKRCGRV